MQVLVSTRDWSLGRLCEISGQRFPQSQARLSDIQQLARDPCQSWVRRHRLAALLGRVVQWLTDLAGQLAVLLEWPFPVGGWDERGCRRSEQRPTGHWRPTSRTGGNTWTQSAGHALEEWPVEGAWPATHSGQLLQSIVGLGC